MKDIPMINNHSLLVSVVVITYNSEDYILECLESVKAQTYAGIELIISDDCSQDNTLKICKEWVDENKIRFVNIEIIEVKKNTGTTENINRACRLANGVWIKPIAGDDLLLPKCIEYNLKFSYGKKIIFSQVEMFNEDGITGLGINERVKKYFQLSAKKQFEKLYISNFIKAPSVFIETQYLKSMNYFNEEFKLVEDYPFWLEATYNNVKLHYYDETTVRYRQHKQAISTIHNVKFNVKMFNFETLFYINFLKNHSVGNCLKINRFFILLIQKLTIKYGNKDNVYQIFSKIKYLNLCNYVEKIKSVFYR